MITVKVLTATFSCLLYASSKAESVSSPSESRIFSSSAASKNDGTKIPFKFPDNMVVNEDFSVDVVSSHGRYGGNSSDPTLISLSLRAAYLLVVFLPVLLFSGLAAVSEAFRTIIWYKLIIYSLGAGGAVSFGLSF